jgi:RNA polymerase sigma factor (sigma-70 family)
MDRTSLTLLDRLREEGDDSAWRELNDLYSPVLRNWLRRYELQSSDADDLIQEVLLVVSREVGTFEHSGRTGAFRTWLKTTLINRLRDWWRSKKYRPVASGESDFLQQLDQLNDPNSELSQIWNAEHDRVLIRQLLAIVESQFSENTREAFQRVALDGENLDQVAKDLGISRNAVIIAKHRVLKALRQSGKGLIGD